MNNNNQKNQRKNYIFKMMWVAIRPFFSSFCQLYKSVSCPQGFGLMVNGWTIKALLVIGHQFKSLVDGSTYLAKK